MKKRILSVIISAAIAASALTATAFAAAKAEPADIDSLDADFFLDVGDIIEPDDNSEDGRSGFLFEVTEVLVREGNVYYYLRLLDSGLDLEFCVSDNALWENGFCWIADV